MLIKNIKVILCVLLISLSFSANADANNDDGDVSEDVIGNMLMQSMDLIGIPYKWGGNTPSSGLDCSGFVRYVFKKSLGITLPRTAAEMARLGKNIPLTKLKPGDLLFFNTMGGKRISHMGMYLGNNQFIQSPRTGKTIEVSELSGYYRRKFVGAKRMVEENTDDDGHSVLSNYQNIHTTIIASNKKIRKRKHHR